jgi:hypothetical protein
MIVDHSDAMGYGITPFEIRALLAVDKAYRIFCSKKSET